MKPIDDEASLVCETRKHTAPSTVLLNVDSMRALALTAGELVLLQQRAADGGALLSVLEAWPSTKPPLGRVFVHPDVARLASRAHGEGRLRLVVRSALGGDASRRSPPVASELFISALLPPSLCESGEVPAADACATLKRCVRAAVRSRIRLIAPTSSVLVRWCGVPIVVRVDRVRAAEGEGDASLYAVGAVKRTRIEVAVVAAAAREREQRGQQRWQQQQQRHHHERSWRPRARARRRARDRRDRAGAASGLCAPRRASPPRRIAARTTRDGQDAARADRSAALRRDAHLHQRR